MKRLLEDMKGRHPRIPLPELTAEEKEKAEADPRAFGYEGRLRQLYLPNTDARGYLSFSISSRGSTGVGTTSGGGANARPQLEPDPSLTLDSRFKTMLFWIASRSNNCQYCLGHQESRLLSTGMTEDEIAALDCDWSAFSPAEQAAFALARRLTLEPHKLSDADLDRCRKHYTDLQILEMVLSVAGNNSINRWKEGVGVPQSQGGGNFGRRAEGVPAASAATEKQSYLTPTSEKFLAVATIVAPIVEDATIQPTQPTVCSRPSLEPMADVDEKLASCRERTPRLPVVDEAQAREVLGEAAPAGALPQWMRLLANFPIAGKRVVISYRAAEEEPDLSPLLKAQVSWVVARQDRAWYALGEARRRLVALGQTAEQIEALDGDRRELSASDRALLVVACNLAASPVVLTDDEVAEAVKLAGPGDVVRVVSYTTFRASFDRFTEAAGLPIEP